MEQNLKSDQYFIYDGMGNRVAKINSYRDLDDKSLDADPVAKWCLDNNSFGYNGQYFSCTDCMFKNNLYLEFYGREAGGKVLATYKSYPDGHITAAHDLCLRTSFSHFEPYFNLNLDHFNLYGSGADGIIGMEKVKNLYSNVPVATDSGNMFNHLYQNVTEFDNSILTDDVGGSYREEKRMPGHREYEILVVTSAMCEWYLMTIKLRRILPAPLIRGHS